MSLEYAKDQPEGFTNRIERVAIVGAGGQLGRHITESLVATGKHTVTVLSRAESKSILPEGVRSVPVNYDDQDTLVSALQGQQFLIITLSINAPADTHGKIVRAAAKAGVTHIMPNVYTCDIVLNNQALGDDVMIRRMQSPIIEDIESIGSVAWTVLVCGLWYEFSLACPPDFFGFDLAKREVTLFDEGESRINTSSWPQLGRAVAGLLGLKALPDDESDKTPTVAGFRNQPLYVSSFFASQRDMFDSVKRVTGTTDADWTTKHENMEKRIAEGKRELAEGNMMGMAKAYYTTMFAPAGRVATYQHKLHNEVLGLREDSMDETTKTAIKMSEAGWDPHQ